MSLRNGYPRTVGSRPSPVTSKRNVSEKGTTKENNFASSRALVPSNQRSKYVLDQTCRKCETMEEAMDQLESRYGGYINGKDKCIRANGTDKGYARDKLTGLKVKVYRFRCKCNGKNNLGSQTKCPWLAQIRHYCSDVNAKGITSFYVVYRHMFHYQHNHEKEDFPSKMEKVYGLHPTLLAMTSDFIRIDKEQGRSVMFLKPTALFSQISERIQKGNKYQELRHILHQDGMKEKVTKQITTYLYKKKMAWVAKALGGYTTIPNNAAFLNVIRQFELNFPTGFESRAYASAKEIATALCVRDEDHMFIVPLTHGEVYQQYKANVVRQTEAELKKFERQLEQAFMVTSPTGLFQLQTSAARRQGTRVVAADGAGGFCKNGSVIVTIGTPFVGFINDSKPGVRSSLRSICYLHLGGERKHAYCLALYTLRHLSLRASGRPMVLDWGISDHCSAFIQSHRLFKYQPNLCDGRHESNNASDTETVFDEDDLYGNGVLVTQPENNVATLLMQPSNSTLPVPEEKAEEGTNEKSKEQLFDEISHIEGTEESEWETVEAALNCYFHVMQAFKQPYSSYASRFVNKKKHLDTEKGGMAYHHVRWIHFSKTVKQRRLMMDLVLKQWREWGEAAAAALFEKSYCTYPFCNWNYAATEEVGVYANNNATEANNKEMKADLPMNVGLPRLISETFPELLRRDASLRYSPCTISIPRFCSQVALDMALFLRKGIDIVSAGGDSEGYICNLDHMIGVPFTEKRIKLIRSALKGDVSPFTGPQFEDNTPGAIAQRVIDSTRHICHVTFNEDDNAVGDCENCYKALGHGCPAACWVRSKHGQLDNTLEECIKVNTSASGDPILWGNKGNVSSSYKSGKSSKAKQKLKQIHPMVSDGGVYLRSLQHEQMVNLVLRLRLFPKVAEGESVLDSVKASSSKGLLDMLLEFYDDTTCYRAKMIL